MFVSEEQYWSVTGWEIRFTMLKVTLMVRIYPSNKIHSFILLKVYLGVNDKKVDYLNKILQNQRKYEYGVEWGLAHHKYIENEVKFILNLSELSLLSSKRHMILDCSS